VDRLNNIQILEENGIRFIAVTQGLDTDLQNPPSRFPLHVLGAAAEFELALIRERTQAGRARYKRDFESGKVGRTVYSRSGREPASPPSQESVRPGRGTPVATPRLVISPDREVSGIGARDGRPDVAAVFQKLVVGIWNRGGGQGRLLPSGVIRSRSANTMRLSFSNLAVRIRLGLSRCFSELAVFDARLYIRVRRIDEPA
jgi:hypothetical protein